MLSDLSEAAMNAADFGLHLFGEKGNVFTLLHTYVEPVPADPLLVNATPLLTRVADDAQIAWDDRFERRLKDPFGRVNSLTDVGPLSTQVAELTRDQAHTAVVMSVTPQEQLWWWGTSTGDLLKASHVPVLAVPPEVTYKGIRKIMVADDGGDLTGQMSTVRDIAVRTDAEVVMVRVLPENAEDTAGEVDPSHNIVFMETPHSHVTVRSRDVVGALDAEAQRQNADLVVLLHRHLGLLGELFHPSIAKRLAMHTKLPLLVLQMG